MDRSARNDRGFTLVELMVVVLVIAILLAIALPQFLGAKSRSQDGVAKSNLRSVFSVANSYVAANAGASFPDATAMAGEASGLTYVAATVPSTGPKVISLSASRSWLRTAAMSESGSCIRLSTTAGEPPVMSTSSTGSCQASYGVVSTVAGNDTCATVNGTGTAASFCKPSGLVFDSQGNLFVVDFSMNVIRKISPSGVVTTLAGSGVAGSTNATGTGASFNGPMGIAIDSLDNLYVADHYNHRIRKITPAGVVTTFVGSVNGYLDGTGTGARFASPTSVVVDANDNVYISDTSNHRIRKATPAGVVTTVAGSGTATYADGTGTGASFNYPYGVAVAPTGDLFVADTFNYRIRKIATDRTVTTVAGSGSAGTADGIGAAASFNYPIGVTVDASGMIWVADAYNHTIRQLTADGVVTSFAGSLATGNAMADGVGVLAGFALPWAVVAATDGSLFVADSENHRVRRIT